MEDSSSSNRTAPKAGVPEERAELVRAWTLRVLHFSMLVVLVVSLVEKQWITACATIAILALTFAPRRISQQLRVDLPAEFEVLSVLFLYATLFLGEVRGYYTKLWWWDLLLHTSSGLLAGLLAFLLIYLLNANKRIHIHLAPGFIALFAFVFALALGALWEIFEFMVDQLFGANMQKPMLSDPSGLTDTMWDLIVDALGALFIAIFGWWYMSKGKRSFIDEWIRRFVERNPRFFKEVK